MTKNEKALHRNLFDVGPAQARLSHGHENRLTTRESYTLSPMTEATAPAEKVFGNHSIVKYGTSAEPYYDSSYGARYSDNVDFEADAVYGFGAYLDNPPGGRTTLDVRNEYSSTLPKIKFFEQ